MVAAVPSEHRALERVRCCARPMTKAQPAWAHGVATWPSQVREVIGEGVRTGEYQSII